MNDNDLSYTDTMIEIKLREIISLANGLINMGKSSEMMQSHMVSEYAKEMLKRCDDVQDSWNKYYDGVLSDNR